MEGTTSGRLAALRQRIGRSHRPGSGRLAFTCNICATRAEVARSEIAREVASCPTCGSTLRWRSVVAAVSTAIFGRSLVLGEFPQRKDLVALGMSDWEAYATGLSRAFDYANTFYDRPPVFDIARPPPAESAGHFDLVVTSDVLEHVAPPFDDALLHCRQLLRPGGVLVLTVPTVPEGRTDEHFPNLHHYAVVDLGGSPVLVNRTADGKLEVHENLVFHGGAGATLEMRVVAAPDLLEGLKRAGCEQVRPFEQEIPEHGILWDHPWDWPVVARAPASSA